MKLTTDQIIKILEGEPYPDWPWEQVLDAYTYDEPELADAKDAARFLEQWQPGQGWLPEEFLGLMYHHRTMRWESVAEYGAVRAHEEHEDKNISDERLAEIISSDENAAAYAEQQLGVKSFTDADGKVLVFAGLENGLKLELLD